MKVSLILAFIAVASEAFAAPLEKRQIAVGTEIRGPGTGASVKADIGLSGATVGADTHLGPIDVNALAHAGLDGFNAGAKAMGLNINAHVTPNGVEVVAPGLKLDLPLSDFYAYLPSAYLPSKETLARFGSEFSSYFSGGPADSGPSHAHDAVQASSYVNANGLPSPHITGLTH